MRIDILQGAGCSVAIAKRLLEQYGSIVEISSLNEKELQAIEGIEKLEPKEYYKHSTVKIQSPRRKSKCLGHDKVRIDIRYLRWIMMPKNKKEEEYVTKAHIRFRRSQMV